MKQPGLLLAFFALYCTIGNAETDATYFSGESRLNIPYAHYQHKMYDVNLSFQEPDLLAISQVTEREHDMSQPGLVNIGEDLNFHLFNIQVGDKFFQADMVSQGGGQFKVTNLVEVDGDEGITNLGTFDGGGFSYAYSISNNGEWITGRTRNKNRGPTVPVRFYPEENYLESIGTLGGGSAQGRAINDEGLVAGYSSVKKVGDEATANHAFVQDYKTAYIKDLGTLGEGKDSRAYGINNMGKAVGWSASMADNSDHAAFVYDNSSETMTGIGADILGGKRSFAFDISDNEKIVGVATTADGSANAFLYQDGSAKNLGSLDDSGYSEARAVNESGQVTGWSLDADKNYTAFIYDEVSGMQALPGLGGDTKGYDINSEGEVVGSALDADGKRHAFLYKDGQTHSLYALLSPGDQALWKELREAFSINDEGVIVGRGRFWTDKEKGRNSSRAFMIKLP